jgi:DNA/RNA endonuclease YhcR with UshA esterase domain
MTRWLYLLMFFFPLSMNAAPLAAKEAREHVGEEVVVEGWVSQVVVSRKTNVFLNFERPFPGNEFAAVILVKSGGAALLAEGVQEWKNLRGKKVAVSGRVQLYKGRAQIVLIDRAQLVVMRE